MNYFIIVMLVLILGGCAHKSDVVTVNQVHHHALRGDVDKALQLMERVDEDQLELTLKQTKNKYHQRFVVKNELYPSSGDKAVDDLLNIYRKYWRSVLLKEKNISDGEALLLADLNNFLQQNAKQEAPVDNMESAMAKLQTFLQKKNFYSIMGKTLPFFELMIWKKEWEKVYDVRLFNKVQKVKIVFMDQFVSLGWAAYATFDTLYTGGWAGTDKLFCVRPVYDLDSEKFKIIYLAHEARHFSDYSDYPKLQQAELEYRAKLEELTSLNQSLYLILKRFIEGGRNERTVPHSFAEYKVIDHLSQKLNVSKEQVLNKSHEEIHAAAKDLLAESNAYLGKQPLVEKYL